VTVRFSLGSLNLHCGRDVGGRPYSVAAAIRSIAADVVVVQENWRPAGSVSVVSDVATELGYDKPIELDVFTDTTLRGIGVHTDPRHDEHGSMGLAILTRVPVTVLDELPLGRAARDHGERMAQVVLIGKRYGGAVRLVNTHLTHRLAYGPGQLRRLIAAVPARAQPTVIAGDFNMFRPTIQLATGYRTAVRGRTWPAARPLFQIDHILVGRGIRTSGAQTGDPVGSDHLPLRTTIHYG
jgi:endonuclease/exonuclease/phosphatase family metal-dependent hydrolase